MNKTNVYIPVGKDYQSTIDEEDYVRVMEYRWYPLVGSDNLVYAASKNKQGRGPAVIVMHRLIMNAPGGLTVDHLDGNGLNNQKGNLRFATRSEQMHNRKMNRNNKSGYKGVWVDKKAGKYRAQVRIDRMRFALGSYDDSGKDGGHDAI